MEPEISTITHNFECAFNEIVFKDNNTRINALKRHIAPAELLKIPIFLQSRFLWYDMTQYIIY